MKEKDRLDMYLKFIERLNKDYYFIKAISTFYFFILIILITKIEYLIDLNNSNSIVIFFSMTALTVIVFIFYYLFKLFKGFNWAYQEKIKTIEKIINEFDSKLNANEKMINHYAEIEEINMKIVNKMYSDLRYVKLLFLALSFSLLILSTL